MFILAKKIYCKDNSLVLTARVACKINFYRLYPMLYILIAKENSVIDEKFQFAVETFERVWN
jgi:hypothetical protein